MNALWRARVINRCVALAIACVATASCGSSAPTASPQALTASPSARASESPANPNAGCDPAPDPLAGPPRPGLEVPSVPAERPPTEQELVLLLMLTTQDREFHRSIGFQEYSAGKEQATIHIEGAACHQAQAAAALQARYGPDRTRLTLYPLPGPEPLQPQRGPGWRLLAELPMVGLKTEPQFADDEATYRALAARLRMRNPPKVAMAREVVVALLTSGGPHAGTPQLGPCDWVHFNGVAVDADQRVLVAQVRHPRPPGVGCDTAFVPFTYLIAIERAALPPRPFTLRMVDVDCEPCSGETVVKERPAGP